MRRIVLLAAGLLALWAGSVWADSQAVWDSPSWKKSKSITVVAGVTAGDTLPGPFKVDEFGNVSVTESASDQVFNQQSLAVINNVGVQIGHRDSSLAPTNTIGWRRIALCISYTLKDSVSINTIALGVRVQGHYVSVLDSTTTFGWTRWRAPMTTQLPATAPGQVDTIGSYPAPAGGSEGAQPIGTANTAGPDEFVVLLSRNPQVWTTSGPRFLWIILDSPSGPFQAPYTSIRVRPLAAWNTSQAAITYNSPVKLRVDLIGLR